MLKGKVKGLTDVLAWFHTTLSTSVKREQYTLTCNPDSGTFTKTNGGSKNGKNLEFKRTGIVIVRSEVLCPAYLLKL